MPIDEINEPQPAPRASGKPKIDITVRIIDEKTGEQTAVASSAIYENERRLREERKY
jgi:hypothetical protein